MPMSPSSPTASRSTARAGSAGVGIQRSPCRHRPLPRWRADGEGAGRRRCGAAARRCSRQPVAAGPRRHADERRRQRPGRGRLRHEDAAGAGRRPRPSAAPSNSRTRSWPTRAGSSPSTRSMAAPSMPAAASAPKSCACATTASRAVCRCAPATISSSDKDARLRGRAGRSMAIGDLLDRAPEMAWLKPYVEGRSQWTVGVAIRKAAPGTDRADACCSCARTWSAPRSTCRRRCASRPATRWPPRIDAPLPMGSDDIRVSLGNLMAVRARSREVAPGKRRPACASRWAAARVDEAPPAPGLVATGRAAVLDAIDWIALDVRRQRRRACRCSASTSPRSASICSAARSPIRSLVVVPAAQGATAVQVEGAALQGAVLMPAARGRARLPGASSACTGARPKRPATRSTGADAAERCRADDSFDPATIPPLTIDIDDLRSGRCAASARPSCARGRPATGMRIEQLRMRGAEAEHRCQRRLERTRCGCAHADGRAHRQRGLRCSC